MRKPNQSCLEAGGESDYLLKVPLNPNESSCIPRISELTRSSVYLVLQRGHLIIVYKSLRGMGGKNSLNTKLFNLVDKGIINSFMLKLQ